MSDRKRALEGSYDVSASKKPRSETASSNGTNTPSGLSPADLIAQKKAEIAAKIAAMTGKAPSPAISVSSATTTATPVPANALSNPGAAAELARRVAEAKRKVAEAQTKLAVKDNPYMSAAQAAKRKVPEPVVQQGSGLNMTAHPMLLDTTPSAPQSKKDRYKPMQPKFASIKANARNAPTPPPQASTPRPIVPIEAKANPYAVAASSSTETGFEGSPRERVGRAMKFNTKGKHITIANEARQEAQLEQLKQRIAESTKKAGLDAEFESLQQSVRREAPPTVEWWDASLLPSKRYDDLAYGMDRLYIRNPDSPITIYIQHPIPIPGPGDKTKQILNPLKLTKKERKKLRKQRRQAELEDKRDRIRMGLVPPDAPKVRLANLMKVLTSDAVQDPTRVEARVRREVDNRKRGHEKMNTERKLTDEQRREKVEQKKVTEEQKGLMAAVFKVKTLSDPSHRFKVRKNAEQLSLTGLCIFNPQFSFVYVEGAAKLVRNYKRLMLHRIKWTEPAQGRGEVEGEYVDDEGNVVTVGPSASGPAVNGEVEDGEEQPVSLDDNRCDIIWEGQIRERAFKSFKPRRCPTDSTAKEALGAKMAGYWDQAKNFKPQEEEMF